MKGGWWYDPKSKECFKSKLTGILHEDRQYRGSYWFTKENHHKDWENTLRKMIMRVMPDQSVFASEFTKVSIICFHCFHHIAKFYTTRFRRYLLCQIKKEN